MNDMQNLPVPALVVLATTDVNVNICVHTEKQYGLTLGDPESHLKADKVPCLGLWTSGLVRLGGASGFTGAPDQVKR